MSRAKNACSYDCCFYFVAKTREKIVSERKHGLESGLQEESKTRH
jgi:hypothetical protein